MCKIRQIFLFLIGSYVLQVTCKSSDFGNFKSCLTCESFSEENIISRRTSSGEYNFYNYQWQLEGQQIYPQGIILPETEKDVEIIVRCGVAFGVELVVKSGGHSFVKASSGNANSVIVDLSKLNSIVIINETQTVKVGAGALLGSIYLTLWCSGGYFLPGGECPTVGIGGVTTGGGMGPFSRQYGMTTDLVQEIGIVTVNGTFVTVNSEHESDLFWALRGGGGSFGIVTHFVFPLLKAPPKIVLEELTYDLQSWTEVFQAWQYLTASNFPQSVSSAMLAINGKSITLSLLTLPDPSDLCPTLSIISSFPASTKGFSKISMDYGEFLLRAGKDNTVIGLREEVTIEKLSDLKNINRNSTAKQYYRQTGFYVDKMISNSAAQGILELLKELPTFASVWFEAYGGRIDNLKRSDTAFVHRGKILYLVAMSSVDTESNKTGSDWITKFLSKLEETWKIREAYQNYADYATKDYLNQYYAENLHRLIDIKNNYDPENCFKFKYSIPARIS